MHQCGYSRSRYEVAKETGAAKAIWAAGGNTCESGPEDGDASSRRPEQFEANGRVALAAGVAATLTAEKLAAELQARTFAAAEQAFSQPAHPIAQYRFTIDFVSGVSHDLKTLITLIRLYGETLLRHHTLNEQERDEFYRIITRESDRLGRLVHQVLAFSRVERGSLRSLLQVVDAQREERVRPWVIHGPAHPAGARRPRRGGQ